MELEFAAGGGFAILAAGFLIRFLVNFVNRQQKTIENHIKHNTEAQIGQIETNREMTTAIKTMTETNRALTVVIKENFKK